MRVNSFTWKRWGFSIPVTQNIWINVHQKDSFIGAHIDTAVSVLWVSHWIIYSTDSFKIIYVTAQSVHPYTRCLGFLQAVLYFANRNSFIVYFINLFYFIWLKFTKTVMRETKRFTLIWGFYGNFLFVAWILLYFIILFYFKNHRNIHERETFPCCALLRRQ